MDKKLLKKIDAILAKASYCLAEDNEEIREQEGHDPPAKTGATTGHKMPKKAEGRQGVEGVFTGSLREKGNMTKWLYDLLLTNRLIRPKRPKKSND